MYENIASLCDAPLKDLVPVRLPCKTANALNRSFVRFVRVLEEFDLISMTGKKMFAHSVVHEVRIGCDDPAFLHHLAEEYDVAVVFEVGCVEHS